MSSKTWETRKIQQRLGFMIPPLWICECDDVNCREILFGGQTFVYNHHQKGKNNSMKKPEVIAKRSGVNHQYFGKTLSPRHRAKIGRKGEHRSPSTEFKKGHKQFQTTEELSEIGKKNIIFAQGWNRGLTKETDPRVAKNAEAIKEAFSLIDMSHSEEQKQILSEIKKEYFKTHDHPMKDKKHKPETIIKMKISQQKRVNSPDYVNPSFGKLPSIKCNRSHGDWYRTPCQGIKFLRSQWEIKYAKYLDSQNISWYYEFKGFPMNIGKDSKYYPNGKDSTYHPDFWLPSLNKFIEIKGRDNYESWDNNDDPKLKSDKFKNEFCKDWSYEVLFRDNLLELELNLNIKEPKFVFMNKEEEDKYVKNM